MRPDSADQIVCPECSGALKCAATVKDGNGLVREGKLLCSGCRTSYPVTGYIPRFVPEANYCDSFGMQWNQHARTQLDKFNGTHNSYGRFFAETLWAPESLRGRRVLECGSGSGRFTQVLLDAGAKVCSFDYSDAVDANYDNNGPDENLLLVQADIYRIPFARASFDKVVCLGVLQHTPNVKDAFMSMIPYLRPGGEIVVDVYPKHWRYLLHWKYLLRPFTRRLNQRRLYHWVERAVPRLLPIAVALGRVPGIGRYLVRLVPVAHPAMSARHLSRDTLQEWSILDTFDWYSPAFDKPQTLRTLRAWMEKGGLVEISLAHLGVYVGRGRLREEDPQESAECKCAE